MRTDIHRKGAIVPTDYRYVMSYSLATTQDNWPVPSYNVNCILDTNHAKSTHDGNCCLIGMFNDPTKKFAKHGSTGKCTICGAAYIYGDVWQHIPSGEYIHVGHDCADKMHSQDRRAFEHGRVAFVNGQIRLARLGEFCKDNPGMDTVLGLYEKHHILADMRSKVMDWGNLSEKQIAFAKKLADGILNPAPTKDEPEPLVLAKGRGEYTGKFVSKKTVDGPYGYATKGLFLVEQDGKVAKVWMTLPAGVEEIGELVTIIVAIEPGNDIGFHFGSRPKLKQKTI